MLTQPHTARGVAQEHVGDAIVIVFHVVLLLSAVTLKFYFFQKERKMLRAANYFSRQPVNYEAIREKAF